MMSWIEKMVVYCMIWVEISVLQTSNDPPSLVVSGEKFKDGEITFFLAPNSAKM